MGNARIPSKDIAHVCGVSRAAIHQRIQRLADMEVITGSGYQVDPRKLDYNTSTFIGVRLEKGSLYREVAQALEKIPEVVECHYTTGPYSMLIKVFARDNTHLMMLLNNCIQHIPGVTETETLICLEESFSRQISIPLDEDEAARKNGATAKKNGLAAGDALLKKKSGRKKISDFDLDNELK